MRITPNHVNEYNIATVWETLYGDGNMSPHQPDKNEVSDYVRILLTRVHVRIGYGAIWTEAVFKIVARVHRNPPVYKVEDLMGVTRE